jgi:hypothetical protein
VAAHSCGARQWQPTPLESGVLPMHVTVALPVTVHAPLQVKAQVPWLHDRLEFGPTLNVQELPLQMTWHVSPQAPLQVAPVSQVNAHVEVVASQVDVEQLPLSKHSQE